MSRLHGLLLLCFWSCAHRPLSASALREVHRVAFLSRIEDGAGPQSQVFRSDGSYGERLKRLDPKEGDRRLALALAQGTTEKNEVTRRSISRFEIADSLRSQTLALLPKAAPWDDVVHPAEVARALESFLVQEVPANAPDYGRLAVLGADSIVEIVVEEYGMRSQGGRAGIFLRGWARMFRFSGGELYHRRFEYDDVSLGMPHLDPFSVRRNTELFAERMRQAMAATATQLAADLTVEEKVERAPSPARTAPPSSIPVRQEEDPL